MSLTTTTRFLPPLDGSVNFAEIIDFNLKYNPSHPLYVFSSEEELMTITTISHLEFTRACHRVAHLLRPSGAGENGAVVAVIALVDTIVYQAIVVGLVRAGLVPFPISPRNSPAAIAHLLRQTSAHRLITTKETLTRILDGVRSELAATPEFGLSIETAPSLKIVYPNLGRETESEPFEPYSCSNHEKSPTDVALYIHSSGSTGFPKPIPQTYQGLCEWAAIALPSILKHPTQIRLGGMALPAFHTLGVYVHVIFPLYGLIITSVYPPVVRNSISQPHPPTPESILEHLRLTKSNAFVEIPAMLQGISQVPGGVELLKEFHYVTFSGGPILRGLAESLTSAGVNLQGAYGATETGAVTVVHPHRQHDITWEWMEFSDHVNMRWVPQGDGTFEAQYLTSDKHHPSVENIQDTRGYATSDLFEQHPTKKHLWRIVGRIDDVIIHSSGEKTVPAPMENVMLSSPMIRGVVMFGRERDQAGVLLEPAVEFAIDTNDHVQVAALRNQVWPVIEEANKDAPAFSHIYKEMILIASPDKPLPRSSKVAIMRKTALQVYDAEIEMVYRTVESNAGGADVVPPTSWDKDTISEWLVQQAKDIHGGHDFSVSKDLFEQGFDSLSAIFLRLRIFGALKTAKDTSKAPSTTLSQNVVYINPTIDQLSQHISILVSGPNGFSQDKSRFEVIQEMISKHSADLDESVENVTDSKYGMICHTVLITGTTGNLGSETLALLLLSDTIGKVYALNRLSSDSRTMLDRHWERFADKGLDLNLMASHKLVLVEGNTAEEHFGLPLEVYEEMRDSVTLIIHIAWRLDFNLTLNSFESNIRGTRNLINLARSGPNASTLRFLFTSSVASAQSLDISKGVYPAEVIYRASSAVGGGYGEGKYVAEQILAVSGLHATSFRVGQIAGGKPNGAWATSDWVPILVKSSLAMGAIPNAAGVVSWLPMGVTAQVLLDVAFSNETPPTILDLVHPKPVSWNYMIAAIRAAVVKAQNINVNSLPLVPMSEWIARLESYSERANNEDFKRIPAIKLLDFFRAMAQADVEIMHKGALDNESGGLSNLSTEKTQKISRTLKELREFEVEDAELWVSYWKSVGFF